MSTTITPDIAAITARQQATWASGDYSAVAARIPVISELLVDAADLRSGDRVLDVAGGSGNTALAAARSGCDVTSLDYVPSLLERGRQRAAAEGLPVEFVEGDAQAMPFPDGAFDAVISVVGVMFAADQEAAARPSDIQGFVDAYDFAELSQDFSEFTWDQQAGLSLSSSDEELTLKVLDLNDRSVCENVADLKTKCNWHLDPDVTFKVIIDNSQRSTETGYRLCAS